MAQAFYFSLILITLAGAVVVGINNLTDQMMADNVFIGEIHEINLVDAF
jgi:hypothetical protein